MSLIKQYWEDVTLELFGAVTQETLEKARPIAQERMEKWEQEAHGQALSDSD